jgi:small subunit ribosomal protein S8
MENNEIKSTKKGTSVLSNSVIWFGAGVSIAEILLKEGYIKAFELVDAGSYQNIHITLKYGKDKSERIITGLKRISKPGLRIYSNSAELPKVLGGLGTAIVSTNKGVITDKEARKQNVGGEVIAFVW